MRPVLWDSVFRVSIAPQFIGWVKDDAEFVAEQIEAAQRERR